MIADVKYSAMSVSLVASGDLGYLLLFTYPPPPSPSSSSSNHSKKFTKRGGGGGGSSVPSSSIAPSPMTSVHRSSIGRPTMNIVTSPPPSLDDTGKPHRSPSMGMIMGSGDDE